MRFSKISKETDYGVDIFSTEKLNRLLRRNKPHFKG